MDHLSPSDVVRRAYRAALRQRYTEANRWVSPALRRSLRRSHESLRGSLAKLRLLEKANASPDLQALIAGIHDVLPLADGRQMWRNRRHGGAVVCVEVLRETVRLKRAWVTVRLHLKEGPVVEYREVLRLGRDGWRIAQWLEERRRTSG